MTKIYSVLKVVSIHPAYQISGLYSHVFLRKCLETSHDGHTDGKQVNWLFGHMGDEPLDTDGQTEKNNIKSPVPKGRGISIPYTSKKYPKCRN